MPYIGRDLNRGNYLKLDDISSSFNSSTTTFNLTVGGSAFTPGSAFSILVSVGGVIQEPESAYQVENSEITFANAPTAQDSFFCLALGVPIGIGVPGNGTVNGTQMAKPFNYDGFFFLDDANNRVGINSSTPTVALDVDGIIKASSFTGGSGGINAGVVTCTGLDLNGNGDVSGNFVIGGDLTVNGTTTTLDTNLIDVDKIEVTTAGTNVAVAVTHNGTGDLVRLYDGTSQVVTVDDEGKVGIGSAIPSQKLDVLGTLTYDGTYLDIGGGVTRFTKQGSYNSLEIGYGQNSNQNAFIDLIGDTTYTDYGTRIIRYGQNGANGTTDILHRGTGSLNLQTSDAASIVFKTNGNNERLRITSDGYVGIKETNPIHALSVGINTSTAWDSTKNISNTTNNDFIGLNIHNTNSGANPEVGIMLRTGASGFGQYSLNCRRTGTNTADLIFRTRDGGAASKEVLRIAADGKVGIGTNNPLGTLSLIADDQQSHADIVFQTKGGTSLAHAALSTTDDSGGTDVMLGANLYLSTNGTQTRYNTGRSGSAVRFGYSGTIRFYNNNSNNAPTERLRIDSDGRLLQNGMTAIGDFMHQMEGAGGTGKVPAILFKNGTASTNEIIGGFTAYNTSNEVATIYAKEESANDDAYLQFSTKATGGSLTERLRIASDGRVQIAGQNAIAATSLTHRLLVRSQNDSNAIAIAGRNGDHIGELSFYQSDASTKLGEIEGHTTHLNLVSRTGYISFATGGTTEKLKIASDGTITHTNFNGVGLHMSGGQDPTLQISDTDGTNQYVQLAHNGGDSYIVTRNNTSHGGFRVYSQNGSETLTRFRIDSAGRIHTGNPGTGASDDFNITALGTGATLSLCRAASGNASDGDLLGSIAFQSYPAGQGYSAAEASIRSYAETGQSGSAAPTSLNFYTKPSTVGPGASASERMRIESDGRVHVGSYVSHNTSVSGIFAPTASTSGKFSYKAIEIGTGIASGTDQGAIIVGRRKATSSSPGALVGCWDDGTDVTLYYGGGWGSHAGSATRLNFYTDTYNTGNNSGSIRLSIGSKGQIFLNNRDSNNSSHRGNIIAYAPISGEFSYKSLEIGSMQPTSNSTGGLIVSQRKGTTAYPFAMMGSWDDGSNCNMYYGGGWGSQSANATIHRFYTGSYQGTNGSSGTEVFTIDNSGNLKQQRISSGGSGFSYFTGSSEYVFGSTTSSPSSGGAEAKFQIHDAKTRATLSINGYMNNAGGPFMQFVSSRSGTVGTLGTKAIAGDYHGDIRFMGDNGTNYQTLVQSASIQAKQVTSISDGDTVCGGEIQFYTGNNSAGSVTEKLRLQNDGKLKYGLDTMGLPGSIQGGGFMMYADNGSNNITRLTFTGLISGCYIATIGYYNAAGQGMGGAMFFVSGYQTANHTYDIHEVRRWDGASNSAISGVTKSGSNWYIEITNTHGSYNGGGEVNLYGDSQATFAVTYRQ